MNKPLKLASASILFRYSTHHLSPKDLVRFYYALKGRDSYSGILAKTNSTALAKRVILSPRKAGKEMQDFFQFWKCPVKKIVLKAPVENKLIQIATAFKKQHKEVSDILLVSPRKITVLLNSPRPQQIINSFKKLIKGFSVSHFQTSELFKPKNKKWLDLFSKGISLTSPKPRSSHTLFLYSTKELSPTDKVRFYYAFKGRDGESGILKRTASEFLAKGVILVPIEQASAMQDFLKDWHCEPEKMEVIVESRDE